MLFYRLWLSVFRIKFVALANTHAKKDNLNEDGATMIRGITLGGGNVGIFVFDECETIESQKNSRKMAD